MIYYIGSEEHPYIKIGYTKDLVRRLTKMQSDSPFTLVVYKTIEGDSLLEEKIHKRFHHLHKRGEWYKKTEEILDEVSFEEDGMEIFIKDLILNKEIFPAKEVVKILYPNLT